MALAGKQAGFIAYGLMNPSEETAGYTASMSHNEPPPVKAAAPSPPPAKAVQPAPAPARSKSRPAVVRKSVPAHHTTSAGSVAKKAPDPAVKPKPSSGPLVNTIALNGAGPSPLPPGGKPAYAIQTGVFMAKKNAVEDSKIYRLKGYSPSTIILSCENGIKVYAVRVGNFADQSEAKTAFANFRKREKRDALLVPLYDKQHLLPFCSKADTGS